jgi:hypothetical protein
MQEFVDLVCVERSGEFARPARCLYRGRRIAWPSLLPPEKVEERADGGQAALDTASGEAPSMQLADPLADIRLLLMVWGESCRTSRR